MLQRKLFLYIAMSLDGYIATPDGDLQFLSIVEKPGEDYGYGLFIQDVDTVIAGRKTYDKILSMGIEWPHAGKESYIITRQKMDDLSNIHFYNGDIDALVNDLKSRSGKNIFCDGGAEIVQLLMNHKLIDEFIISIIPVVLGTGIRLFSVNSPADALELISCISFEKGLVQLHYKRI